MTETSTATPAQGDTVTVAGRDGEWRLDYFVPSVPAYYPNPRPEMASVSQDWWPRGGTYRSTIATVSPADLTLVRRGYEYAVQPDPYA